MQCTDRAHTKKEKKEWFAAVKRGSDTASQDTALCLHTYYRRTFTGYRRFHVTFDIAYLYGINVVK